jgi:hypothetical protein
MLTCGGVEIAPAFYEFEGYQEQQHVTSCGEIRTSAAALRNIFGRGDIQLRLEDARSLTLTFSEKKLPTDSVAAHVDISGAHLTTAEDWNQR